MIFKAIKSKISEIFVKFQPMCAEYHRLFSYNSEDFESMDRIKVTEYS